MAGAQTPSARLEHLVTSVTAERSRRGSGQSRAPEGAGEGSQGAEPAEGRGVRRWWRRREQTEQTEERLEKEVEESVDDGQLHPERAKRQVTDCPWLCFFLVGHALLGCIVFYANYGGAASRVIIFHNFEGRACGVGENWNKSYVFICRKPNSSGLALNSQICTAACPNSSETESSCYNHDTHMWQMQPDYATMPVSGSVCVAVNETLQIYQRQWVAQNTNLVQRTSLMIQVWKPLVACVVMAIIASNFYIMMLSACASVLVWIGLFLLSVVPTLFGLYFFHEWHIASDEMYLLLGILLVATGMGFCFLSCCASFNMDKATILIELSCKCYTGNLFIRVGPVLVLAFRFSYSFLLIRCILQLYSMGMYSEARHVFLPNGLLTASMVFTAFMLLWTHCVIDACWDFCLAFFTETWYFSGGVHNKWVPSLACVRQVLWTLVRYHMGTMVQGGLVVGFLKPLRLTVGALTAPARSGFLIPLVSCLVDNCCCCLVELYANRLEVLSKNFIMDTVLTGSSFWPATTNALAVVSTDHGLFSLLNGATWFFQVAGIGLTVLMGNFLGYFFVFKVPGSLGPMGGVVTIGNDLATYLYICAWTAGLTALPYMLMFDTVSDTILYSHLAVKKLKSEREASAVSAVSEAASYVTDTASYLWDNIYAVIGAGCGGFREKSSDELEVSGRTVRGITLEAGTSSDSDSLSEDSSEAELLLAIGSASSSSSARAARGGGLARAVAARPQMVWAPGATVRPAGALAVAPPQMPALPPPPRLGSRVVLAPVHLPQQQQYGQVLPAQPGAPAQVVPGQLVAAPQLARVSVREAQVLGGVLQPSSSTGPGLQVHVPQLPVASRQLRPGAQSGAPVE